MLNAGFQLGSLFSSASPRLRGEEKFTESVQSVLISGRIFGFRSRRSRRFLTHVSSLCRHAVAAGRRRLAPMDLPSRGCSRLTSFQLAGQRRNQVFGKEHAWTPAAHRRWASPARHLYAGTEGLLPIHVFFFSRCNRSLPACWAAGVCAACSRSSTWQETGT